MIKFVTVKSSAKCFFFFFGRLTNPAGIKNPLTNLRMLVSHSVASQNTIGHQTQRPSAQLLQRMRQKQQQQPQHQQQQQQQTQSMQQAMFMSQQPSLLAQQFQNQISQQQQPQQVNQQLRHLPQANQVRNFKNHCHAYNHPNRWKPISIQT